MTLRRICVFCGASRGSRPDFAAMAWSVGALLAHRGVGVVYGGGGGGLMGAVADGALAHGGEVTGVIPGALVAKELAHHGVSDMRVVHTMHERKALMAELSDGFIALPGGFGTLDELFETLTWGQLGMHEKPCGVVNHAGFFDGLLRYLADAAEAGFVRPEHHAMLLAAPTPEPLLDAMVAYEPPELPTRIDKRQV